MTHDDVTSTDPEPTVATVAGRPVRDLADGYVAELARLDPGLATHLGTDPLADGLGDLTPDGAQELSALRRRTLAALHGLVSGEPVRDDVERRCAVLLRERLEAEESEHDAREHLRSLGVLFSPVQRVRSALVAMGTDSEDAWAAQVRRTARVEQAYAQYTDSLREGLRQGLPGGPAQARDVVVQLDEWAAASDGRGWYAGHLDAAPDSLRADAATAGGSAQRGVRELRRFLAEEYLPAVQDAPDTVGEQRYRVGARRWTGSDLDPRDAYEWGWAELARIRHAMAEVAAEVLPGASPAEAMHHLDEHGPAVEGVEAVREHLQELMDRTVRSLDGDHFDIAPRVAVVEAMIAPPGSAAAPYYTRPSLDFARPGRTWLPTLGRERFPLWDIVSTWYHEGVPGHHLQLAQWAHLSGELSVFQTSVGSVSATTEGWALYAETLMTELGYLEDPGERMGYLNAQALRAVRVVIDIGMHLGLEIPADQHGLPAFEPGQRWTPELAARFLAANTGLAKAFRDSEIVRYLGMPGQAISYKLGERAWLQARDTARQAAARRGETLDLRAWHMAALGTGSLGLDDLVEELSALP